MGEKMEKLGFENILNSVDGDNVLLHLTIDRNEKLLGGKKNPHQGKVRSLTTQQPVRVYLGERASAIYAEKMNEKFKSEGKEETFEKKKRAWGERIENTPFIQHKDKFYLECFSEGKGEKVFLLEGEEVSPDELDLPKKQETPNDVGLRVLDLSTIIDVQVIEEVEDE